MKLLVFATLPGQLFSLLFASKTADRIIFRSLTTFSVVSFAFLRCEKLLRGISVIERRINHGFKDVFFVVNLAQGERRRGGLDR